MAKRDSVRITFGSHDVDMAAAMLQRDIVNILCPPTVRAQALIDFASVWFRSTAGCGRILDTLTDLDPKRCAFGFQPVHLG